MKPLFDALTTTNQGALPELMAQQFRVSQNQAHALLQSLTPAFSEGLQRKASEPSDALSLLSAFGSGAYQPYGTDPSRAFGPSGFEHGRVMMDQIFRNAALTNAVVEQTAKATDLPESKVREVLPVIASVVMGAIARQMTETLIASSRSFESKTVEARPEPTKAPAAAINPWAPYLQQMQALNEAFLAGWTTGNAGAGPSAAKVSQPSPRSGSNRAPNDPPALPPGIAELMAMFRVPASSPAALPSSPTGPATQGRESERPASTARTSRPATSQPDATDEASPDRPANDLADMFKPFFEVGDQVQKAQIETMRSIFDAHEGKRSET